MSPVEVITSIQRRIRWTAQQKKAMVEEAEQPGNSISSVARKYEVHPNQLFKWRRLIHEGALVAAKSEEPLVPISEVKQLQKQIRELQRLLGKKTMEVEILKGSLEIAREKNMYTCMIYLMQKGLWNCCLYGLEIIIFNMRSPREYRMMKDKLEGCPV